MASTAISLHLRPNRHRHRLRLRLQTPTTSSLRFFSSSSSSSNDHQNQNQNRTQPQPQADSSSSSSSPSSSSFFREIRANLKQTSTPLQPPRSSNANPDTLQSPSSKFPSFNAIRDSLSGSSSLRPPINSFQESYKRNLERNADPGSNVTKPTLSLGTIRDSLKKIAQSQQQQQQPLPPPVSGGGLNFSRYMPSMSGGITFSGMSSHKELGEKLRELRPEVGGDKKNWFSLAELKERLEKLKEIEKKEAERKPRDHFIDLRESLHRMSEDNLKKEAIRSSRISSVLSVTPNYMSSPPKETLVEKYFHPDHMSSAEKMKLELKKVRDKFKTSESDCGSTPVQVAQLTTKIKHLAAVLHKKDKHSRKGLQAMVQQRKRLLKYLRRTDWDSYCHVLSELGLRDSPDYKT